MSALVVAALNVIAAVVTSVGPSIGKLISDVRSSPDLTPAAKKLADKMLLDDEALVDSHKKLPDPKPTRPG